MVNFAEFVSKNQMVSTGEAGIRKKIGVVIFGMANLLLS